MAPKEREKGLWPLIKLNIHLTCDPADLQGANYQREEKHTSGKDLYKNIHSRLVHTSQKLEIGTFSDQEGRFFCHC